MDKQYLMAIFADEHDLLKSIKQVRNKSFKIHDVYTPYAVHGIEDAMGLKPSFLTYVCFAFALTGVLVAILTQFWIGSIDWPINVGGKPFNSLPAYLPVTFELLVLFGGLGVVFSFLFIARLRPGKVARIIHPEITDDRFALLIEVKDAAFDFEGAETILKNNNVLEIKQIAGETI